MKVVISGGEMTPIVVSLVDSEVNFNYSDAEWEGKSTCFHKGEEWDVRVVGSHTDGCINYSPTVTVEVIDKHNGETEYICESPIIRDNHSEEHEGIFHTPFLSRAGIQSMGYGNEKFSVEDMRKIVADMILYLECTGEMAISLHRAVGVLLGKL